MFGRVPRVNTANAKIVDVAAVRAVGSTQRFTGSADGLLLPALVDLLSGIRSNKHLDDELMAIIAHFFSPGMNDLEFVGMIAQTPQSNHEGRTRRWKAPADRTRKVDI